MKNQLAKVGVKGDKEVYIYCPSGFIDASRDSSLISKEYGSDTSTIFDDTGVIPGGAVSFNTITVGGKSYRYVPFGQDNLFPYKLKSLIGANMVTSESQDFNIRACYGQGVRFIDKKTKETSDNPDIERFCLRNSLHEMFLEQCTDMKYMYFMVTVIILSRDYSKIVQVRHKDVFSCRFELANDRGVIEHIFYANWLSANIDQAEVIDLLDPIDPLGDLMVRLGKEPNPYTGEMKKTTNSYKFAIVSRMPTFGCSYYPEPYYSAIFRDSWYDIYRLIGIGKRYKIKNNGAPRFQIEVHKDYWMNLCDEENITDPQKRAERIKLEKQNINDYVTGIENAGKTWITGYYIDPNGKENRMVRVYNINEKKEGGDWSDDIQEASNSLCFALGVHPNLIGATPGKSQMNNSGSDKRELFTLKQSMQKPDHDIMLKPYRLILEYNGWSDKVDVDVPMVQLTTLDQNKDSQVVSVDPNNKPQKDGNNNQ